MPEQKVDFDLLGALLYGIFTYVLALILESTEIFSMVANLPTIGLFLGIVIGGFRKHLNI